CRKVSLTANSARRSARSASPRNLLLICSIWSGLFRQEAGGMPAGAAPVRKVKKALSTLFGFHLSDRRFLPTGPSCSHDANGPPPLQLEGNLRTLAIANPHIGWYSDFGVDGASGGRRSCRTTEWHRSTAT